MLEPRHLTKGDNLRPVSSERRPSALAALAFVEMIDHGTAVERVESRRAREVVPLRGPNDR